ncbi:integrase arm-type DNA-binding domain-containing protein [Oxalobacter vibrioformis]|uniref:Integrase arm-type DNA-binding domain-containing protein n=1 Tax=Oxalobacter vibrioformis TaxID=933080 RepID=A0A9E9LYE6_9BURK|nr:integrase arm-type DNA-binding domain-containing protein [Oxalobacter vibrioformis]WAW10997.1 integrase arm-type DNA-binding domain-containing protein [Oxalobacter vibrioformis]
MAKIIKPLSPMQVKNAKPKERLYRMFDGGGLYLSVYPHGSKLWHMKIRGANGKENVLSFGKYPDISLEQARQHREEVRKLRAKGGDPVAAKKAQKALQKEQAANSFEVIAREWYEKQSSALEERTLKNILSRLEKDVFPWIGTKPIIDMTAPDYLAVFRKLEDRGILETAHRVRGICGQIQRYAIATGRATYDPITALRGALKPFKTKHLAAITEPEKVGQLLRMIDGYTGSYIVACAMRIAPYVFVRPGELRKALWSDIDLGRAEWRYIATKTNTPHIVPLSKQAVTILQELHPLTGHGKYVFPR